MYRYDFSVVMAVYNVERYLREAVESLVHQSIGFDRIQLILVDDGSTDGSGAICDEYERRYPDNVVAIHKENGRQASARNAGLKYIQGKYVNFMDPDDTMEAHAFQKVFQFMERHAGEVDVCCIPVYFFGNNRGAHILNGKFKRGTRVIDLTQRENAECVPMSASATFYRRQAAERIVFDTELYTAEDKKFNLCVLMDNPKIGVVTGTRYNYRKYGDSTLDKAQLNPRSYLVHLAHFSNWALDEAQKRLGVIPAFIQFAVMYDLQWNITRDAIPKGVLEKAEEEAYRRELVQTACRIDEDIILRQKYLENRYKVYLICRKRLGSEETPDTSADCRMIAVWEFLEIDPKRDEGTVEGHLLWLGGKANAVKPGFVVNGRAERCEPVERTDGVGRLLGQSMGPAFGFRARFPLDGGTTTLRPAAWVDGALVEVRQNDFGNFFPVSTVYDNASACYGKRMVSFRDGALLIAPRPGRLSRLSRECRLLREIWQKDLRGGRKAVGGRLYYHLAKPFKRRRLWIISDRVNKADDNGEALFRYLREHRPAHTRVIFAVRKDSGDYARMKQLGECVSAMSFRHKLLFLLSDVDISSHAEIGSLFSGYNDALRDLLRYHHFVFLQHGVTKDDVSGWLNRFNQNISGFVTAALPEWQSIVRGRYHYTEDIIWLTGFPRFDRLYHSEDKRITIAPTWRHGLVNSRDEKTGQWSALDSFGDSDFFRFYNALLNSERLLGKLEEYGYALQFLPHPNLQNLIDRFDRDDRVRFLHSDISYRDVYAESDLMVTDYSSAVFDFAYLRKPIVYCQFDKARFYEGQIYDKGYFDYERDGFGEVTYDLDSAIDRIIEYVENGCALKDAYRRRIDNFFAYSDQNNCRRVVERILALPERR